MGATLQVEQTEVPPYACAMTCNRVLVGIMLLAVASCGSESKDKDKDTVKAKSEPKPGASTTPAPAKTPDKHANRPAAAQAQPTLGLNNGVVHNGVLMGGQPTDEQLKAAKAKGFKTVISLRTAKEPGFANEEKLVKSLGMKWVSIPVAGKDGLTAKNAEALAAAMKGEGVMAHCGSGNRVGALVAIKAKLDGKTTKEALAVGKKTGLTKLEPATRKILEGMAQKQE